MIFPASARDVASSHPPSTGFGIELPARPSSAATRQSPAAWLTGCALAALLLLFTTPPVRAAERLAPGWQQLHLDALPIPARQPNWFSYRFNPRAETFEIYVPRSRRPGQPCGVFAWVNPDDSLRAPHRFEPLYEEFGLIAIAAANCGNERPTDRRIALLVSALLELSKTTPIDRRRCVISGYSGGGRCAAIAGFVHPEIWAGALSWCGGRFYRNIPVSAGSKHSGRGIRSPQNPDAVTDENVRLAKARVRFVLLTGTKDFNQDESMDIYLALTREGFQSLYLQEPGLGHEVGSVETMRRGLAFALGAPAATR